MWDLFGLCGPLYDALNQIAEAAGNDHPPIGSTYFMEPATNARRWP